MGIIQTQAKILENRKIKENYFLMRLSALDIAREALPGQFVNIKITDSCQPLLRRPFSIHRIKGSNIEILYEAVGSGTEILSRKKQAATLDIIGPLGRGFAYPLEKNQPPVLIAGGIGVAPLFFLAEKIKRSQPVVLLGAKTKDRILCEKEFKDLGCDVKISTEDGSAGFKGKATDFLKQLLSTIDHRPSGIYACGPMAMLKAASAICRRHKIPAQVSLEAHMACGIGACLGCAVRTKKGYQRVCKEGPVFFAEEICW